MRRRWGRGVKKPFRLETGREQFSASLAENWEQQGALKKHNKQKSLFGLHFIFLDIHYSAKLVLNSTDRRRFGLTKTKNKKQKKKQR